MIVYFLNRGMLCLGMASTSLPRGYLIINDKQVDEIESGISSIEFDLLYPAKKGGDAYALAAAGNYILTRDGEDFGCYTILTAEESTEDGKISIYAEDAGIDLLNEVAAPLVNEAQKALTWYTSPILEDSGWEIGQNDFRGATRVLNWSGESTVAERLREIASGFDGELSFSFEFRGLRTPKRYVNFYKRRGAEKQITLSQGVEVADVTRKRSVENLCTALKVTGDPYETSKWLWIDGNTWFGIKWSKDNGDGQIYDYPSEQDGTGFEWCGVAFSDPNTGGYGDGQKWSSKGSYVWTQVGTNSGTLFPSVAPRMVNGQYVHLVYANYTDGRDITADPRGKRYMGYRTHQNSQYLSTNPRNYVWVPIPLSDQPPLSLEGMIYDDGDLYVDQSDWLLKSRSALTKWSRYLSGEGGNGQGHIIRTFNYSTTNFAILRNKSVQYLRKYKDEELTFEASLLYLPESVQLGDTVNIVDEWSNIRIRARLLKLERSRASGSIKATFGNYAII